jgi:hypothetical protein
MQQMGPELGAQFSELWQRVVRAHVYWGEFVEMFSMKPGRLDIMNGSAPAFFHMLQGELSDMILLHLSRMTDKEVTAGKKNLTIRNLPGLVSNAAARDKVRQLVDDAVAKTETCRAHRNSLIAHDDLLLALNDPAARVVDPTTKREIDDALKAIGEVLRAVNLHFCDSDMMFDWGNPRVHGFVDLLYVMRDGLKAREARQDRLRAGKYTEDDLKHEDL